MRVTVTKEWLQRKLKELEELGVEEAMCGAELGLSFVPNPGTVVRAKMRCNSITKSGSEKFPSMNVQLGAVYSNDPASENRAFANATPSASVNMNIDSGRPAAHAFQLEGDYYVDFIPLGVPEYKYIRDGIPSVPRTLIISKGIEGREQKRVYYNPENGTFSYWEDNVLVEDKFYAQDSRTAKEGYTHWRDLRSDEGPQS